jgi:hypothetical protein
MQETHGGHQTVQDQSIPVKEYDIFIFYRSIPISGLLQRDLSIIKCYAPGLLQRGLSIIKCYAAQRSTVLIAIARSRTSKSVSLEMLGMPDAENHAPWKRNFKVSSSCSDSCHFHWPLQMLQNTVPRIFPAI